MTRASLKSILSGTIARGSIISLAIRLLGLALVTVQAILTARLLGAEGYGIVAYAVSLANIMATVVLLGTQPLAVREVARLQTVEGAPGLREFVRTIRLMVLAAAVFLALAWAALGDATGLPLAAAFLFPLIALTLQSQGILRGFGLVARAQVPHQILRPLVLVGVLLAAYALPFNLTPAGYLAALCLATFAGLGAAFLATRTRMQDLPEIEAPIPALSGISRDAAPFLAVSVIALLLAEINTLMLTWWSDAEQTGLFQPIARIAPLLMLGMHAVSIRYAPRISELWTAGETERLIRITRQVTLVTTAFTLAIAVLLLAFGSWILGLFGREFAVNAPALWWIAAAQIVNVACGPVGLLLTMSDKANSAVVPRLAGLAVNLAVGTALIPGLGVMGAAMAMAAGIAVWNVTMLLAVKRLMGFDPSIWGILKART